MTQMQGPNEMPEPASPDPQGEAPPPVFRPYVHTPEPTKQSRGPLVFFGLSVVVLIGGLAFWSGTPDQAEAESPAVPVGEMTAEQLAEKATPAAARELVRRMLHGTEAEHAGAAAVMNRPRSARLNRNLAMGMALEQQKRANDMRLRAEREIRMAEYGQ